MIHIPDKGVNGAEIGISDSGGSSIKIMIRNRTCQGQLYSHLVMCIMRTGLQKYPSV